MVKAGGCPVSLWRELFTGGCTVSLWRVLSACGMPTQAFTKFSGDSSFPRAWDSHSTLASHQHVCAVSEAWVLNNSEVVGLLACWSNEPVYHAPHPYTFLRLGLHLAPCHHREPKYLAISVRVNMPTWCSCFAVPCFLLLSQFGKAFCYK